MLNKIKLNKKTSSSDAIKTKLLHLTSFKYILLMIYSN